MHRAAFESPPVNAAVLFGILGCGRAAERLHLPALARIAGARLTAAYDPGPERRDLIARAAPGCRAFESVEALLAARVVDAVIVASPKETHAELTIKALQAGVPALVDAPLASSLDEAAWMRAEEREAKVPTMVGFNRRWWEAAEALRHHLAASAEDAAASAETVLVSDGLEAPRAGRPTPSTTWSCTTSTCSAICWTGRSRPSRASGTRPGSCPST